MSGTIVDQATGAAVRGAEILVDTGSSQTRLTTDNDGRWDYSQTGGVPLAVPLSISAPGYVTRQTFVRWQLGSRTDITIDIIRDSAPFSMQFYREFVRDLFARPEGSEPLRRWTSNPNFYINTVNPKSGGEITSAEVERIISLIRAAVPPLTGGKLQAGAIESGPGERAPRLGYIDISFYYEPEGDNCGTGQVASNPGRIRLNYGATRICGSRCGNFPWRTVVHEVGHSLGYWHTRDGWIMGTVWFDRDCDRVVLSPAELHHATVAYARPPGNRDPDSDPTSGAFLQTEGTPVTVRCR